MMVRGDGSTPDRRPGPDLPRRDGRAVVRQRRLRPRRDRRRAARPGAEAAVLPLVLLDGHGHAGAARRAADRDRAARHVEGALRQQRLRRQRHPGQARPDTTTTSSAGPQKKKIISRWRGYHGVSLASASLTGLAGMHAGVRPPARRHPARPRAAPAVGGAARARRRRVQRAARGRARGAASSPRARTPSPRSSPSRSRPPAA